MGSGVRAQKKQIAVAGKPDRPSREIIRKIHRNQLHPFWTVPFSIVRKELDPEMQAEPD